MVWHARRRQAAGITAVIAVLALVAGACSDDDGGEETGAGGAIAITLQEFAVTPSPAQAPAGDVTFDATNEGPDDVHEFVVFATDLTNHAEEGRTRHYELTFPSHSTPAETKT